EIMSFSVRYTLMFFTHLCCLPNISARRPRCLSAQARNVLPRSRRRVARSARLLDPREHGVNGRRHREAGRMLVTAAAEMRRDLRDVEGAFPAAAERVRRAMGVIPVTGRERLAHGELARELTREVIRRVDDGHVPAVDPAPDHVLFQRIDDRAVVTVNRLTFGD